MQAQKAFDSPRRASRGAVADLRDRLNRCWPKGLTASPPKREIILTPLNETYKGLKPRAYLIGFVPGINLRPTVPASFPAAGEVRSLQTAPRRRAGTHDLQRKQAISPLFSAAISDTLRHGALFPNCDLRNLAPVAAPTRTKQYFPPPVPARCILVQLDHALYPSQKESCPS